jgi:hypothetical protein
LNNVRLHSEVAVNTDPDERRDQVAADLTVASCAGFAGVVALYGAAVALGAEAGFASVLRGAVGIGTPICLVGAMIGARRTHQAFPRRLFALSGALVILAPLVAWLGVDPSTIAIGFGLTVLSGAAWWLRVRAHKTSALPREQPQDALPGRSAG